MLETLEYPVALIMEQPAGAVNQQEIGWLCGILDTDGNTALTRDIRWCSYRPEIKIVNTNEQIIKRVISLYAKLAIPYYVRENTTTGNWKTVYDVTVSGVRRVARYPFLRPPLKSYELDVILQFAQHRLAIGKGRYDETDTALIQAYSRKFSSRQDPQRLHAMLSEKTTGFLSGWLAGVIDGDGAITLSNNSPTANGSVSIRPVITVASEHEPFADAVLEIVERLGSTGYVQKKRNGPGWIYHVVIANRSRVCSLLPVLLDHLVGKQQQAELVMQFCSHRTSARYNAPYTDVEYEMQRQVKALNQLGRRDEDIVRTAWRHAEAEKPASLA